MSFPSFRRQLLSCRDRIVSLSIVLAFLGCGVVVSSATAWADTINYVDPTGKDVEVVARVAGEEEGTVALELADGEIKLVPRGAIKKQEKGADPAAVGGEEILERLTTKFGGAMFRGVVAKPYVIGVILAQPLPRQNEGRAKIFLQKAVTFFRRVDSVFVRFARTMKMQVEPPRFPLVVLIFETDEAFEKYAIEATGGRGLSAGNILGFYNGLTNHLAIRMSECHTFEVPLHEAIHQQVYNRGVFQRLAPIPTWFNEGIATGFEGNGERVDIGPQRVSLKHGRRAREADGVDWSTIVQDDTPFRGDVLAGDAYTQAWCMHWLIVTKYKFAYAKYLKILAARKTLEQVPRGERMAEFEKVFGKTVAEMQREFPAELEQGLKRQKLTLDDKQRPGYSLTQSNLGEVELTAVNRGGRLELQGRLKNISPLRDMTYHVSVVTGSGAYADWVISSLKINRVTALPLQSPTKLISNAPGGPSSTFRVLLRSVPTDSEEAKMWANGNPPVPRVRVR